MGKPVMWFEIVAKDATKAQKFYSDLFDWKVNADNPMNYGMVETGGKGINGGICGPSQGCSNPRVTVYVEVEDLEAQLKKAERLGGKTLVAPMQVPNGPRIALLSDPDGNCIGLHTPPKGT